MEQNTPIGMPGEQGIASDACGTSAGLLRLPTAMLFATTRAKYERDFRLQRHGNMPVHFGPVLRKIPLSRALPRNDHLPKIRKCSPSNREANRFRIIIPRPESVELSLPETILGCALFLRRAKLRWAPSRRTTLMAKSRAWPKFRPAFRVIRRRHPGTFSADESNSTDTSTSPRLAVIRSETNIVRSLDRGRNRMGHI